MRKIVQFDFRTTRGRISILMTFLIFAGMLVLNALSPWFTDDFHYRYSFYDDTKIEHISQILLSLWAHRYSMNGRLVAHGIVQFLGMFPAWVFDIINAGMFVFQLLLIDYISRQEREQHIGLFAGLFSVFWIFCPAFGQVNLWQDGSCNYLWSIVFNLLFLLPFVDAFLRDEKILSRGWRLCFLLLSFCAGAYTETVSAAAIGVSMLLVLLMVFFRKKKNCSFLILADVIAILGYISIYTAPAQWGNKSAGFSFPVLLENLMKVFGLYFQAYWLLLAVFAAALVGNLVRKAKKEQIILSLVFFLGSLAAQGILTFAKIYYNRTTLGAFVFLLMADWVLLYQMLDWNLGRKLLIVGMVILSLSALPFGKQGCLDILDTYYKLKENEKHIYACKEAGIMDVSVPVFYPETKYSEAHDLKYLDIETPMEWPNYIIAKYYGVNSIIGIDP